jgi:hypothetical protein
MEFCFEDKRVFSLVCCLRYARFHQQSVLHATARLFGSPLCKLRLSYSAVCFAGYGWLIRQSVAQATALLFGSLLRTLWLAYTEVCFASYGSLIHYFIVGTKIEGTL